MKIGKEIGLPRLARLHLCTNSQPHFVEGGPTVVFSRAAKRQRSGVGCNTVLGRIVDTDVSLPSGSRTADRPHLLFQEPCDPIIE
jgi:hypothetical protein